MKLPLTVNFVRGMMLVLLVIEGVHASENVKTIRVVGESIISGQLSYDQATQAAINQARVKAVENAGGIMISNVALIEKSVISGDFIKTLSNGMIISEKVLGWENQWIPSHLPDRPPYPRLSVTLEAKVKVTDKSFMRPGVIDVSMNRSTFRNGETVEFKITPDEDVFVLIVNRTSKGDLVPIFPNEHSRNNKISSGRSFVYPGKADKGITVEVNTYESHKKDVEAFFLFAVPVDERTRAINWLNKFPYGKEFGYAEFHDKLLQLPIKWLGEQVLLYEVNKS